MRFTLGAALAPHGIQKLLYGDVFSNARAVARMGLPDPLAWSYAVGCVECFGGLFIAAGFLTRFAALAVAIEMAVITFAVQWHYGYFWTRHGFEFPMLIFLWSLAIFFRGGGRYSIDHAIGKEL